MIYERYLFDASRKYKAIKILRKVHLLLWQENKKKIHKNFTQQNTEY